MNSTARVRIIVSLMASFRRGIIIGCVLLAGVHTNAATLSWSGAGGVNANWNNSANWGFVGTPATGDTLIFPSGQPNLVNTNNILGLTLNRISFAGGAGGYVIWGNSVTVTNGIFATNTAGANFVTNNIALSGATQTINVGSGATLTLAGVLSGSVGATKLGTGTLIYSGGAANTYSGDTTVGAGTLQLNKIANNGAIAGDLVVGDGSGTDTVLLLDFDQINNGSLITVSNGGVFNVSTFTDIIGGLSFNGGTAQSGVGGAIRLNGNVTVNAFSSAASITGELQFFGAGVRAFAVADGSAATDLSISAAVTGTGGIVKSGPGLMLLSGANTYTNTTAVNGGVLAISSDTALGDTSGGTFVNSSGTLLFNTGVNNLPEVLTINGSGSSGQGALYSLGIATIQTNVVLLGNTTINVATNGGSPGTLTINGGISGTGSLTKLGVGTLTFAGSPGNTYSGATFVNEGTLSLNKSSLFAIPSGEALVIGDGIGADDADVVRYGGNNMINSSSPITINGSGLLDLDGFSDTLGVLNLFGGNIDTGTGTLTMAGNVTAASVDLALGGIPNILGNLSLGAATRTFNVTNGPAGQDLQIFAAVSGTGGLIKNGAGQLNLISSNSFSGAVTANDGQLLLGDDFAAGTVAGGVTINGSAILEINGISVGLEPLTLNSTASSGALRAFFSSNSWAGTITLSTNTLIEVDPGQSLALLGAITGPGGLTKLDTGSLFFQGANANTYAGITIVNAGTLVLAKSVGNGAMTNNLIIGDGVGGINTDVVRTEVTPQLPNSVAVTVNTSGLFEVNIGEDFGSLAGSGRVTLNAGISVGYNNGNTIFSGIASGVGSFNKYGIGMMTLSGNNTHTGATTANDGILQINGFQPQSPVSVGASGTLRGFGTVGNLNNGGGGIVAPGTSPGMLTCSNATFSGAASDFTVEIGGPNPGTGYDQLNARGTVNLGGCTLNLTATYGGIEGQSYTIVSNDAADAVVGTFNGLAEGAVISAGLFNFRISYIGGSGNDVTLTTTNPPIKGLLGVVGGGNGNNAIDPNECNLLYLVITNTTGTAISNVYVSVSSTTDHVILLNNYSDYPPIPANGTGVNLIPFQLSTLPGFSCGSNIVLNLSVSFQAGSFSFLGTTVSLPTGHPGAPALFTNNTFLTIPDATFVNSTNVVSGISGPIAKVKVSVYLTHPNDGDLALRLIAPDGTLVVLSDFNGGPGDNYGADCSPGNYTVFDDAAATSITAGSPPYVGTFRPEGSLASLIGKSGPNVNGNWRLQIEDDVFGGGTGTLRCWVLEIMPLTCDPGSGICDTCPGYVTDTLNGVALTNVDRMSRNGIAGQCGAPQLCGGAYNATGPYRYDMHVFTNSSNFARCYRVYLDTTCEDAISASAYVGSYQPTNVCQNFLAEMGNIPSKTFDSFSFIVPAATNFVVVVNEVFGGFGCDYTLVITGDQCPRPVLNITPASSSSVKLDWTTTAVGYQLERTNTLVTGVLNWPPVTNQPVVVAGRFTVTNSVSGTTNNFYRLKQRLFD